MGRNLHDLTGRRFGMWTVVRRSDVSSSGKTMWLCVCNCGTARDVASGSLTAHRHPSRSCGCVWVGDLAGRAFGALTVVSEDTKIGKGRGWLCHCQCGSLVNRSTGQLRAGRGLSCSDCRRVALGESSNGGTKEYRAYRAMKDRCTNKRGSAYHHYGGRGIRVCDEWTHSYRAFLSHIGRAPTPAHTIDRIDVNGNYEPGNVRWATPTEQGANRRCRVIVEFNGRSMSCPEWERMLGLPRNSVRARLAKGAELSRVLGASA